MRKPLLSYELSDLLIFSLLNNTINIAFRAALRKGNGSVGENIAYAFFPFMDLNQS
jgi:hypothetical protein